MLQLVWRRGLRAALAAAVRHRVRVGVVLSDLHPLRREVLEAARREGVGAGADKVEAVLKEQEEEGSLPNPLPSKDASWPWSK